MNTPLQLFTIGFTQISAEEFFARLQDAGVRRVVDVRLHNSGQLAGFTKRDDLGFFLRTIGAIDYIHQPVLAPTREMLRAYRSGASSWKAYAQAFTVLLRQRQIETTMTGAIRDGDCLLCSEPSAAQCHRRIVAEYLQERWKQLRIKHL